MKVLLVDDSTTIRMMLKGLLKQLQIVDVVEAGDGLEALTKLESEKVDLVLLDLHMPHMDGLAFLAEMRRRPALAHLPAVVISSDTGPEQTARAMELGVVATIRKPFRLDSLKAAVDATLVSQAPQAAPAEAPKP
ncbi:MAG TPA: response regulator [Planctomycetota bacterium]|jgi:two-component system chemotaxis response regulator CheY